MGLGKIVLSAVAGVVLLATSAIAWVPNDIQRKATENLYSVDGDCTGYLLDPTNRFVFTAAHCVQSEVDEGLKTPFKHPLDVTLIQYFMGKEGKKGQIGITADVITSIPSLDIAILRIPNIMGDNITVPVTATTKTILAPKNYNYISGSDAYAMGNPYNVYGSITKGVISKEPWNNGKKSANRWLLRYSGGIGKGSSGGPLFDDNGVFIGIASAGRAVGETEETATIVPFLGYYIPASDIWTVLEVKCIADKFGGVNPATCLLNK
jgi:S1-C subfamily serine protease